MSNFNNTEINKSKITQRKQKIKEIKMNEVYLIGKIVSKIDYKFITSKKYNAIARFEIILNNESTIKAIAYDNVADKILRRMNIESIIFIYGRLNSKKEVIVQEIKNIK